jgi:hypothetical protein
LRRLTPLRAITAMVGAVVSSTMRERKPSATNNTTLCGLLPGICAEAAEMPAIAIAAANDNNLYIKWLEAPSLTAVCQRGSYVLAELLEGFVRR